jgi:prolyl oligopeptidase
MHGNRTSPRHRTGASIAGLSEGGIWVADDPHRWLEGDSPGVLHWESLQDAAARAHLDSWPSAATARELIGRLTPPTTTPLRRIGDLILDISESTSGPGPLVCVRQESSGEQRVLLDIGAQATACGRGRFAMDFLAPSPDGRHVVIGASQAGSEQSVLHVLDLQDPGADPVVFPHAARTTLAWIPDGSGFYFSAGRGPETETMQRCVVRHRFGGGFQVEEADLRGHSWVAPQVGPTHAAILVYEGNFLPRPWYVRRHEAVGAPWTPFLPHVEGMVHGTFVDDEYVAVHISGSGNGRVVSIPVGTGAEDAGSWRVLLDESDTALIGLRHLGGDRLLVGGLTDGDGTAVLMTLDGKVIQRIGAAGPGATTFPVPIHASAAQGSSRRDPLVPTVVFTHSSTQESTTRYSVDTTTGVVTQLDKPALVIPGLVHERRHVPSTDGALVPIDIFRRADVDPSRPVPTLISGYGGFNLAVPRGYDPLQAAFVASGGTLVIAQLRGGGELGWRWWQAGRLEHKQHTFDDLYAIAEDLIARGETTPAHLGVYGMSNGGLLAAVAVTQRPELWGAVVVLVPVCDLERIGRDPWGFFRCAPEYGDPTDPEQAVRMLAYSPCHNTVPGTVYPPTLVVVATADSRTYPWHGRKFVAALQEANGGASPIQLLNIGEHGHFAATDAAQQHLWLGFLMRHLGVTPVDPDKELAS